MTTEMSEPRLLANQTAIRLIVQGKRTGQLTLPEIRLKDDLVRALLAKPPSPEAVATEIWQRYPHLVALTGKPEGERLFKGIVQALYEARGPVLHESEAMFWLIKDGIEVREVYPRNEQGHYRTRSVANRVGVFTVGTLNPDFLKRVMLSHEGYYLTKNPLIAYTSAVMIEELPR